MLELFISHSSYVQVQLKDHLLPPLTRGSKHADVRWCFREETPAFVVLVLLARAEGQGRSVAARGDKRSKRAQCLALCSALNCVAAAREP